jgi:hypothetical protein
MKFRKSRKINLQKDPKAVRLCHFCHRRHVGASKTGLNAGDGCKTWVVNRVVGGVVLRRSTVVPPAVRKAASATRAAKS